MVKNINEMLTDIVNDSGKQSFGIRVISQMPCGKQCSYIAGDYLPNSYQWIDGCATDDQLAGVSAIQIGYDGFDIEDIDSDLKEIAPYLSLGNQIVLIGGSSSYEGTDAGEIVIAEAEVLYVFG